MRLIARSDSGTVLLAMALATVALALGCGDDPVDPPPTPVPTTITISPAEATLGSLGETVQLTATVQDQNGQTMTGVTVVWASRNNAVATVDGNGLVTAEGNGVVVVQASVGALVGTADVTVAQQPVEVRVSPSADTLLALDDTVQLSAEALDANGHTVADAEFTWSSADESVVTVDATGLATAVANGTANVTASVESVTGTAEVTVAQRAVEVRMSPPSDSLAALGDTVRLSAEAFDANGHVVPEATFSWTSGDTLVVTVDATGLVTAVGRGSASVTATTGEVFSTAAVTVEQRPVEVRVSPGADTVTALGDTIRLMAAAFDANGHVIAYTAFQWRSGDPLVVTVDATGLVTAVGPGSTSVTATTGEISGTATLTVEQRPFEVRMSPGADTLVALGDTIRLMAEAFDANGHTVADAEFTWSSADESVVTVDAAGLATAVGNGTARVTASVESATGTAEVTVAQRPMEVRVSPPSDSLAALGDTVRLSAEAFDANGHVLPEATFMWGSGDTLVVTVDSAGLATAVANGSTALMARLGTVVGTAALTVAQRAMEIRVSPSSDTLLVADTVRLSAEATDANGHALTNARFTWSSGDEAVATVDPDGLVAGVGAGSVQVTVVDGTAGLERTVSLLVVAPREELVDVYEALGGSGWANAENWGTDAPVDEWYGVTTDEEGRITGLDLSDNGLTGPIPPELGRLESLEVLDLSGNGITAGAVEAQGPWGPTPDGFSPYGVEGSAMAALGGAGWPLDMASPGLFRYAYQQETEPEVCAYPAGPLVPGDGLTGSIPPALGALKRLRILDLSYNSLTGSIPPELGNIESLEVLNLGWNNLTGSIPAELGRLEDLQVLALCFNPRWDGSKIAGGLTGAIPPELGNLANLETLNTNNNRLSGPIPPEVGRLRNLRVLNLSANNTPDSDGRFRVGGLTGPIPPELGDLGSLQDMSLAGNNLSGSIPPELGNLTNLQFMVLAVNSFSGSIPPELGNLANLKRLSLSVSGRFAADYNTQGPYTSDDVVGGFTGSIPSELGRLTNLESLELGGNDLSGSIPPELGELRSVEWFQLAGNELTGTIPMELGELRSVQFLGLDANFLTGIPPELGNLSTLERLQLQRNELSTIPPELGNLSALEVLGLSHNKLSGTIPKELGDLQQLGALVLNDNDLTGAIPPELAIESLWALQINNTKLSGRIPREFIAIPLSWFWWFETDLCAPPDQDFQDWLQSIRNHMGGETCPAQAHSKSVPSEAQQILGSFRHTRQHSPIHNITKRGSP